MKPTRRVHPALMASAIAFVLSLPAIAMAEEEAIKTEAAAPADAEAAPPQPDAEAAPAKKSKTVPAANEDKAESEDAKAKLSEAQILLFETPHLQHITTPSVITYKFERKSQFNDSFKDEIKVNIDEINEDGTKDVSFDFFTGQRRRPYPPVENFKGNPLLMFFLSRDVHEMNRLIQGNPNFFRTTIRNALVDKAKVTEVEVPGPHGKVEGHKIELQPYLDEVTYSYQMGPNLLKTYEFIVADEIPGGIYSIRTVVPPEPGSEEKGNVIEETLVFDSVAATPVADAKE